MTVEVAVKTKSHGEITLFIHDTVVRDWGKYETLITLKGPDGDINECIAFLHKPVEEDIVKLVLSREDMYFTPSVLTSEKSEVEKLEDKVYLLEQELKDYKEIKPK